MEPTYENVEPLLTRSRPNGPQMEYFFRCPVTGFEVMGAAPIPQYDVSMSGGEYAKAMAVGSAQAEGQLAGERALDRLIPGGGFIADTAYNVLRWRRQTRKGKETVAQAQQLAQELPKQMLLTAFQSVADKFRWDEAGGQWVKAG